VSLQQSLSARAAFLALLLLASPAGSAIDQRGNTSGTVDCVVLLHGLWRSALSMKAMQWGLEGAGYRVVNLGYPSTSYPIEKLAVMAVEEGLASCASLHTDRVNFVTHSLGGILVRLYLSQHTIPNLGRVVMLGPPNGGSGIADHAESMPILRPFLPPAVAQLGTSPEDLPRQLGRVNFSLGVIAGTSNYTPFIPGQPQGPGDGTVAVSETLVSGLSDFLELPVSHSLMMWDDEVIEQTIFFLRHGRFKRLTPPFIVP
jgi:triacylglycerol lipase